MPITFVFPTKGMASTAQAAPNKFRNTPHNQEPPPKRGRLSVRSASPAMSSSSMSSSPGSSRATRRSVPQSPSPSPSRQSKRRKPWVDFYTGCTMFHCKMWNFHALFTFQAIFSISMGASAFSYHIHGINYWLAFPADWHLSRQQLQSIPPLSLMIPPNDLCSSLMKSNKIGWKFASKQTMSRIILIVYKEALDSWIRKETKWFEGSKAWKLPPYNNSGLLFVLCNALCILWWKLSKTVCDRLSFFYNWIGWSLTTGIHYGR